MRKTFSIILPIYKQSDHVQEIIKNYSADLPKLKKSFEIILVVNGNDIQSHKASIKLKKKYSFIKVLFLEKSGWGNAVKAGINEADADFIAYTNSARTRSEDLRQILEFAHKNPGFVIKANRLLRLGAMRKIGSTLYNIECRILLRTPVWDINGTPKVIPGNFAHKMNLKSEDDLIDAELAARCRKMSIPIIEYPVLFPPRIGGKSTTNFKSAIRMYLGVISLRKIINN